MSTTIVPRALYDAFEGQLEPRVTAFAAAVEAHRLTVGVPAPVEHPLVEALARSGAAIEIEEPPAPPEPEPDPVVEPDPFPPLAAVQFFIWLLRNKGVTEADVLAKIAEIPDPIAREEARLYATRAPTYRRDHPLVEQLGVLFEMTSADIDAAWPEAAAL